MSERFRKSVWPEDTNERIMRMRSEGRPWREIAESFGVDMATIRLQAVKRGLFVPNKNRRFTADDDAKLRAAYVAQRDLKEVAEEIGCSYGVLRQRLYHYHHDLINTVRTPRGSRALRRYGMQLMEHGSTPDEAAVALKSKIVAAKAAARVSAMAAKEKHANQLLDLMNEAIAAGKPRNTAIFEARALGLSLERIGQSLGVTGERIRQICDAEAMRMSLETDAAPQRDILYVGSAA